MTTKLHNILLLLTLLLLTPLASHADDEAPKSFWDKGFGRALKAIDTYLEKSQREGIDTMYQDVQTLNHQVYIGGYGYWYNYQQNHLNINAHGIYTEGELGLTWKGLTLEVPIPYLSDFWPRFGLAKNGSTWGFRLRYRQMQPKDPKQQEGAPQPGSTPGSRSNFLDPFLIPPQGQSITMFFAEGYYGFNHKRFSLGAGLYSDMLQKRSAGSMLLYTNYYHTHYHADSIATLPSLSLRTQQVSLGLGYGYNLSLMQGRLVFHSSVVPMLSFYSFLSSSDPSIPSGTGKFRINSFFRFAANYSFDRYIISGLLNYRHFAFSNNVDMLIRNQDADAQINFCVRF